MMSMRDNWIGVLEASMFDMGMARGGRVQAQGAGLLVCIGEATDQWGMGALKSWSDVSKGFYSQLHGSSQLFTHGACGSCTRIVGSRKEPTE